MQISLTPLQRRVLRILADMTPRWTLTGGGALVGFYLGHRTTKDVALFFLGLPLLGDAPRVARGLLAADGLAAETVQDSPQFSRLRVRTADEVLVIDLVAEPVAGLLEPHEVDLDGRSIRVDTAQEILGNKLGALYSRWEIRDLVDVKALLEVGADLELGLSAAAIKDGGFGRADLAWALSQMNIEGTATKEGYPGPELAAFARELQDRLLQ